MTGQTPLPSPPRHAGKPAALPAGGAGAECIVIPDETTITGRLSGETDLYVAGRFDGRIDLPAHAVTIAEGARVDAEIFARDVTIFGAATGKITAVEIVDLRPSSQVSATVVAPSVALADGASFHGRMDTRRADAAVIVARYRMEHDESADEA